MTDCRHLEPKAYHCVQCLLNEITDLKEQLADSDIVNGHYWREAVETVQGKRVFNAEQHHCTLVAKIEEQQEAIWELQEMYSELEGERNTLNSELHKVKARHCAMDDCKCQPVFCAKCTDAQTEDEVATAYDHAAQTVQECGCRCKPNRRKCDLCDAAAGVLLLKDERTNANN